MNSNVFEDMKNEGKVFSSALQSMLSLNASENY